MLARRILQSLIVSVVPVVLAAGAAFAETPNFQYVNIAPLPGAGTAIDAKGVLDGNGAMQVNIPVAFTPGWGYLSLGQFKGEHPYAGASEFDNGSAVFGMGFFRNRRVFLSGMQVSRVWSESKAVSGQVMLTDETDEAPAISVGMQDILKKETDGNSAYIVLTKSLQAGSQKLYATLGYGGGRFLDKPFAGVSMPLGGSLNLITEWDGFQFNNGMGWRPGGKDGKMTVTAAYNGHAGVLLGCSLACAFAK